MESFASKANGFQPLTIAAKLYFLDVCGVPATPLVIIEIRAILLANSCMMYCSECRLKAELEMILQRKVRLMEKLLERF